jgi:hypothetical protein
MIASGVQGGHVPAHDTLLVIAIVSALALAGLAILVYRRAHPRRPANVSDEWGALAVMGELCPHGWKAEIRLYGWGAPLPEDAPTARTPPVAMVWTQFDAESRRIRERSVWAASISEGIAAMVADRRTELDIETLEERFNDEDYSAREDGTDQF